MKTKYLFIPMIASLCAFTSCSSSDDDNGTETKTPSAGLTSSTALTYVSLFTSSDLSTDSRVLANVPLTGQNTPIEVYVPSGTTKLFMQYPTAEGTKIQEVEVPAEGTRADPGSATYMYEVGYATTITIAKPDDAVKNYVTNKDGFTNYHSSGVILFEDTWPSRSNTDTVGLGASGARKFGDLNDLVVDYDLEATVNDAADKLQAWKEDLKVVMHVRAMGGGYANSFGLLLEGLDKQYVDAENVEILVGMSKGAEAADPLTATVEWQGSNPIIYINDLDKLIDKTSAAANGMKLTQIPKKTSLVYNTYNDENLNVGRGLFTVTVTFRGKERSTITQEQRNAQIENFKNAVINTHSQNFFLKTTQAGQTYETHLAGYEPTTDFADKYASRYNDKAAGQAVEKDANIKYQAADGYVWGVKVPTITRHATEKTAFTTAYPQYLNWITNKTSEYAEWYLIGNANMAVGPNKVDVGGNQIYPLLYVIEQW